MPIVSAVVGEARPAPEKVAHATKSRPSGRASGARGFEAIRYGRHSIIRTGYVPLQMLGQHQENSRVRELHLNHDLSEVPVLAHMLVGIGQLIKRKAGCHR